MPNEDIIDYTQDATPGDRVIVVTDPNNYDPAPKGVAAKYAFIRSGRVIFGALSAAIIIAITDSLASLTPVGLPGDLNSDTFSTFIIVTVLGAGLNGLGKFLRDRKIVTNPPV